MTKLWPTQNLTCGHLIATSVNLDFKPSLILVNTWNYSTVWVTHSSVIHEELGCQQMINWKGTLKWLTLTWSPSTVKNAEGCLDKSHNWFDIHFNMQEPMLETWIWNWRTRQLVLDLTPRRHFEIVFLLELTCRSQLLLILWRRNNDNHKYGSSQEHRKKAFLSQKGKILFFRFLTCNLEFSFQLSS